MKTLAILLLATAGLAAKIPRGDAPCTNEACTSHCNATPSCQSTLFDPDLGQCYTFACVVNNYSAPSEFLGYQKPGASDPCPYGQPVPGEPESPPPPPPPASPSPQPPPPPPPASEPEPPATEHEPEKPAPTAGGVPGSLTTKAHRPTDAPGGDASPTAPGGAGATPDTNEPGGGEPSPTEGGGGDTPDPAAPTIVLPGAAPRALAPAGSIVAVALAMLLL